MDSTATEKKYMLAYSKPLALKGGALTYRYKR